MQMFEYSEICDAQLGLDSASPNYSQWYGKRVLILGASGLVGSSLVDSLYRLNHILDQSMTLTVAGRSAEKLSVIFSDYPGLKLLEINITDNTLPDHNFDLIFDAASPADPASFALSPVEVMHANFIGLDHVLSYTKKHRSTRVVYLSSGEVYGTLSEERIISEEAYGYVDPLLSRSSYPISKLAAETLCISYCDQFSSDIVIARLAHVFGPKYSGSDSRVSATLFRDGLQGQSIILNSSGSQHRTYTYISDCVGGLLAIAERGETGSAYNISNTGNNISLAEFASTIASEMHVDFRAAAQHNLNQTSYRASSLDNRKLKDLGWTPLVDIPTGIKRTIHELRK